MSRASIFKLLKPRWTLFSKKTTQCSQCYQTQHYPQSQHYFYRFQVMTKEKLILDLNATLMIKQKDIKDIYTPNQLDTLMVGVTREIRCLTESMTIEEISNERNTLCNKFTDTVKDELGLGVYDINLTAGLTDR